MRKVLNILFVVVLAFGLVSPLVADAQKKPVAQMTETETRLGLHWGDEALGKKIYKKWSPLATEIHDLHPSISVSLILAFVHAESGGNKNASNPSGAKGILGLMPVAREQYKVTVWDDARDNMEGGVHLLADLLVQFEGDLSYLAAAYLGGPNGQVKKQYKARTYKWTGSTANYVKRVLALHTLYGELAK